MIVAAKTAGTSTDRRPLQLREVSVWVPLAFALARRGVTPNAISVAGLAAGLASGALLACTQYVADEALMRGIWLLAVFCIALRGACNILDGVMAVETGQSTAVGLLWNEVPDRITDAATLIGAGYALGAEPVLGWSAALLATLVSYVRVQCRLAGAPMDFCGPMAKPMRMVVVALAALWMAATPTAWQPDINGRGAMAIALVIVAAGSIVTLIRRLRRAARALRGGPGTFTREAKAHV
jgi:phosphatidylglycerophosphate synthase